MVKFVDTYDLPKLNQKVINHLNTSTMSNEIEEVIVSQKRKAQD
jgi:hypothetical protein